MAPRSQPYRFSWPLTPDQVVGIDESFQILFDDVQNGSIKSTVIPIDLSDDDEVENTLGVDHGGTGATSWTAGSVVFAGASGTSLTQDNANVFWDDTNNFLGIGATVRPLGAKLVVTYDGVPIETHSGFANGIQLYTHSNTAFRAPTLALNHSHGTQDLPTVISAGDALGYLTFSGYDGSAYTEGAAIAAVAVGTWETVNNFNAAQLDFYVSSTSSVGNKKRMVLNSEGVLGLGINLLFPSTGSAGLVFIEGTLSGMGANTAGLYADDVAGTVRMFGIDEAGLTGALAMQAANLTAGSVLFAGSTGLIAQNNTKLFWDSTNNELGIGTNNPSAPLHIVNTLLASDTYGTLISTTPGAATNGAGLNVTVNAGYTGSSYSRAIIAIHNSAGVGTDLRLATSSASPATNAGGNMFALATTTGTNVGNFGAAEGGNKNFGLIGKATIDKTNAINIGIAGFARQTLGTPILVGGFFGLMYTEPTYVSAALLVDNGSVAAPIIIARDNGTEVFRVGDGGNVSIGTTTDPSTGTAGLIFGSGTALATMGNNTAGLYADDVSGTVEMFGINEAGTPTQLTGVGAIYNAAKVMQRVVLGI